MFIEETFALRAVREMLRSETLAIVALRERLRDERLAWREVFSPVNWVTDALLMLRSETFALRLVRLILRSETLAIVALRVRLRDDRLACREVLRPVS